jgi:hypothetical protein
VSEIYGTMGDGGDAERGKGKGISVEERDGMPFRNEMDERYEG